MALWSGRFEQSVSEFTQEFGASLEVDKNMYAQDIKGSLAHAKMLSEQGILSEEDYQQIEHGLGEIKSEMDEGSFEFDVNDEDIHMAVEKSLTDRIGSAGARLHTGRSRNDQVATDLRLLAKDLVAELLDKNLALREALIGTARDNLGVVMPGYTHLQHAQPVLFSHHMLAYVWMFTRDFGRLQAAFAAADASPLGSAALAGTSFELDRARTAELLGFKRVVPNSMDAVSDRDYLLDLEYACAVSMMHLSRLSEEIILWSSSEFGFITLSDAYSTGSSIMPQKKNPDFAELTRGKVGRVYGDLLGLLTTMKGLPLAYNKDLQECKEGALDAAWTLRDCMVCMTGMVSTWQVNAQTMLNQAKAGFMGATDVADYLAKAGIPFRDAHEIVGKMVLYAEKNHKLLEDLTLEELSSFSPVFEHDLAASLNPTGLVAARTTYGGTAPSQVEVQLQEAQAAYAADTQSVKKRAFLSAVKTACT